MTGGLDSGVGGGWDPIGGSGDDIGMYIYVHVNNIFINPDVPDIRYFCESASSGSASTVISEIVSPVDGEQYYYIDAFTKEEETDTYVAVDWIFASEGIITSVSDIDNFYDFDKHYTRAIPSLPSTPDTPDTPDTPSDNPSTPDIPDESIDGLSISEIDINGITYSIKDKSIYTKEEVNAIFNLVREKLGLEPFDYSSIDSNSGSGSGSGESVPTMYTLTYYNTAGAGSSPILTVNGTEYNVYLSHQTIEIEEGTVVNMSIRNSNTRYDEPYITSYPGVNSCYVTSATFTITSDCTVTCYGSIEKT